jgi:hypothetical protein
MHEKKAYKKYKKSLYFSIFYFLFALKKKHGFFLRD